MQGRGARVTSWLGLDISSQLPHLFLVLTSTQASESRISYQLHLFRLV